MSEINIGQISEALNDKTDRDMRNVDNTTGADAVIGFQAPTAENGYTWFRKYASGWVEQGGIIPLNTTSLTFPITMADTNYCFSIGFINSSTTVSPQWQEIGAKTLMDTGITYSSFSSVQRRWQVSGMAAQ